MTQHILTAVGPDRPGIVGQLTGHLHDAGANILDSRMVNLRGQFAIVALFECPDDAATLLAARLNDAALALGLTLHVAPQAAARQKVAGLPFRLKTYSMDQPGIVHRITELLHSAGVNIEDLTARQESAPFAGSPLFVMEMQLTIPSSVSVRALREKLSALADTLNIDLDLEPAD